MADNSTTQSSTLATVPAGEVYAFDEVTINAVAVKVGRNKIGYGADGAYTEVSSSAPLPVQAARASTATVTSVSDSAVNQTLLAANANRLGATVHNDSASILYLKLGATASTTSFTTKLFQDDYYEVPFGYTGQIDGIWSADSTGAARITEVS